MNPVIAQRVIELSAEQVGVSATDVTPAHHYVNDLNYDSLDTVEFGMKLEDEFRLTVPDDAVHSFQTVGQVIEYVEEHHESDKG
jgi:acyl carrier protein